jgi:acyl-CoA reductase-like NAD-dependent aldehyde dehydrogenase
VIWRLPLAHLIRWHDLILEARADLATIITLECGKPLGESQAEITSGCVRCSGLKRVAAAAVG